MDEQNSDLLQRISRYVLIGVTAVLVLLLLLALLRISIGFWLWSTVETWAIVRLGLDTDAAQLVTVIGVSLITLLLPTLAWYFFWGKKHLYATGAVVGGQILIFLLVSTIGSGVCFDRRTGKPLCWYVDTPDGRYFSYSEGADPKYGIPLQQYTREIAVKSAPTKTAEIIPSNPQASSREPSIVVRGTDKWLNTGIRVERGQRVNISANGTVIWGPPGLGEGTNVVGPNGTRPPYKEDAANFPIPEAGIGSLVMRIGKVKYAVGSNENIEVRESGTIELMVNDDVVGDNSGSFAVTIRL